MRFLFLGISTLTNVSYNHVFPFLSFIDMGVIWFSEKLFTGFEVYLLKPVILQRRGQMKCELDSLERGKIQGKWKMVTLKKNLSLFKTSEIKLFFSEVLLSLRKCYSECR